MGTTVRGKDKEYFTAPFNRERWQWSLPSIHSAVFKRQESNEVFASVSCSTQFNPDRMRRHPSMEKYTSYSHRLWVTVLLTQALVLLIHSLGGTLTNTCQDYSLYFFTSSCGPSYLIKIGFFWLQISSDTFMPDFFSDMVLWDKYLMCVLTNLLAETFHHSPKVHLKLSFSFFSAEDYKRNGCCGIFGLFWIPELGQLTKRIHPTVDT